MLSDWDVRNIKLESQAMIYSGEAHHVRLEWFGNTTDLGDTYIARTGGSANAFTTDCIPAYRSTPQTISGQSLYLYTEKDVPAYIHILNAFDVKRMENVSIVSGDILIALSINKYLSGLDKLKIIHPIDANKITGTGTGNGSIWTDATAEWTKNQYKNYWLIFDDRRFLILSNTATQLTVELGGFSLPATGAYIIQGIMVYIPKVINPSVADIADLDIGDAPGLQYVICERNYRAEVR